MSLQETALPLPLSQPTQRAEEKPELRHLLPSQTSHKQLPHGLAALCVDLQGCSTSTISVSVFKQPEFSLLLFTVLCCCLLFACNHAFWSEVQETDDTTCQKSLTVAQVVICRVRN